MALDQEAARIIEAALRASGGTVCAGSNARLAALLDPGRKLKGPRLGLTLKAMKTAGRLQHIPDGTGRGGVIKLCDGQSVATGKRRAA